MGCLRTITQQPPLSSGAGYDRIIYRFTDIEEVEYLLEIYRTESYYSSYEIAYADAEPISIRHLGGSKDEWDFTYIQGSELTFKFYIPREDVEVIDDLMNSQYRDYYVRFKKGSSTIFYGFLKPENMYKRFETNPPYIEIELSATDGLAELKDIDVNIPYVDPETGRHFLSVFISTWLVSAFISCKRSTTSL